MQSKQVFKSLLPYLIILLSFNLNAKEADQEFSWPIEIESENEFVTTVYQPQLESFESDILEGRMAVTIKPPKAELIFGALWFKARMSTDLDNRTVVLEKMEIVKTHFPEMIDEEKINTFSTLLSAEMESWDLEMSLDHILASLDEIDNLKQLSDQIKNDPPVIYFRTAPAVLMMIDGDPILKKDEESGLEYVVNSPFFIVKDTKSGNFFINGGSFWYSSKDIHKAWSETSSIPSNIKSFAEKNQQNQDSDSIAQSFTKAPEIIISTSPAELIIVDGEIEYNAIKGTNLLYVSNSESDIIMDISSQNHYILLAGRWYYSKSLQDGDWKFCEPDKLPDGFNDIPDSSEMASVLASIPGTEEAQIALLEQSIPQTATVDRKEAKVEVSYDGNPKFEKIEGTKVSYAQNTDKTVLLIDKTYYCVDDAIWFMSDKATGPWEVCVVRPEEVNDIPPEAPVYNVKYVYIYDSTPDVVYVGYLPGYNYSYVYGGVVVYGTGYYYRPWYANYYYPRPVTYGYGVHYNPYTGWGFSVGISYGWVSWGFHPYHRCYWGPRGYHGGYRHGYHHGYRHGYRAGYAAGNRNTNRNVYQNRNNGVKQTGNPRTGQAKNNINNKARPSTGKANNMYTDRNGNVYQRDNKGNYNAKTNRPTQQPAQRPSTGQQPTQRPSTGQQPAQRPATNPQQRPSQPSQQPQNRQQMDRSYQNRNQGAQNYNRSQQHRSGGSGANRSGGAGGGRGGRR